MRPGLLNFVLALVLAAPAGAQVCKQTPPPLLPSLFPESVEGLSRSYSMAPGAGCLALYRGASTEGLWAVLSAETNPAPPLGEAADALRSRYQGDGKQVVDVDGWPLAVTYLPKGDEFTTLRGSVQITVLVKNGDQGAVSEALAAAFFRAVFPNVPCGG